MITRKAAESGEDHAHASCWIAIDAHNLWGISDTHLKADTGTTRAISIGTCERTDALVFVDSSASRAIQLGQVFGGSDWGSEIWSSTNTNPGIVVLVTTRATCCNGLAEHSQDGRTTACDCDCDCASGSIEWDTAVIDSHTSVWCEVPCCFLRATSNIDSNIGCTG